MCRPGGIKATRGNRVSRRANLIFSRDKLRRTYAPRQGGSARKTFLLLLPRAESGRGERTMRNCVSRNLRRQAHYYHISYSNELLPRIFLLN